MKDGTLQSIDRAEYGIDSVSSEKGMAILNIELRERIQDSFKLTGKLKYDQ
jgi:hypothetical protein